MQLRKLGFCSMAMLLFIPSVWSQEEMGLSEIFDQAKQTSETLKIQTLNVQMAKETQTQARALLYPNLSFVIGYTRLDAPLATSGSGISVLQAADQYDGRLSLKYTGLQGFRELNALDAAEFNTRSQVALAKDAERVLFISISNAYYELESARALVDNLKQLLAAAKKQEAQLSSFVQLGKSQNSELAQQQAQTAIAKAALAEAQGVVNAKEHALRLLAGIAEDATFARDLSDPPLELPLPQEFFSGLDSRFDIVALNDQVLVADKQVSVALADYFPSLDVTANVHAFRSGALANSVWDVGFVATVPLFDGFGVMSKNRQADYNLSQRKLDLLAQKRSATIEIQTAYDNANSLLEALPDLKKASALAKRAWQATREEFTNGRNKILDVTSALNAWYQAQLSYDQKRNQYKMAYNSLLATSGKTP